jgi:hypothetical protein
MHFSILKISKWFDIFINKFFFLESFTLSVMSQSSKNIVQPHCEMKSQYSIKMNLYNPY